MDNRSLTLNHNKKNDNKNNNLKFMFKFFGAIECIQFYSATYSATFGRI